MNKYFCKRKKEHTVYIYISTKINNFGRIFIYVSILDQSQFFVSHRSINPGQWH